MALASLRVSSWSFLKDKSDSGLVVVRVVVRVVDAAFIGVWAQGLGFV